MILHEKRPLTTRAIISLAKERNEIPPHLVGDTPHKTLGARLSEDILRYRRQSHFYRTDSGLFFLWELLNDPSVDPTQFPEIRATRRTKQLKNETVLTVSAKALKDNNFYGFIDNTDLFLNFLRNGNAQYMNRRVAEGTESVKQIVTYILVVKEDLILTYRRGKFSNAADEILGARSIGFGGHVSDIDLDLIEPDSFGILNNAARELAEELDVSEIRRSAQSRSERFEICTFINVDDTNEAKKHLAAVIRFKCDTNFDPKSRELSINDLMWIEPRIRANHLTDFELWSRLLLKRMSEDGTIRGIEN